MAKGKGSNGANEAGLAGKLLTALQTSDLGAAARSTADAAVMLMQACEGGQYQTALEENLELWIALATLAENGYISAPELAEQIKRLAQFVIASTTTISDGGLADKTLVTLITIDLQIAAGFVDAASQSLVRRRAYEIWEEEGYPFGQDKIHWQRAEAELYSA